MYAAILRSAQKAVHGPPRRRRCVSVSIESDRSSGDMCSAASHAAHTNAARTTMTIAMRRWRKTAIVRSGRACRTKAASGVSGTLSASTATPAKLARVSSSPWTAGATRGNAARSRRRAVPKAAQRQMSESETRKRSTPIRVNKYGMSMFAREGQAKASKGAV
eukprot:1108924-Prymnesium_polylepis.1